MRQQTYKKNWNLQKKMRERNNFRSLIPKKSYKIPTDYFFTIRFVIIPLSVKIRVK